jgi:hypothetical protein
MIPLPLQYPNPEIEPKERISECAWNGLVLVAEANPASCG